MVWYSDKELPLLDRLNEELREREGDVKPDPNFTATMNAIYELTGTRMDGK